jgi:hypothetical protein
MAHPTKQRSAKRSARPRPAPRTASSARVAVLVATRKGAWFLHSDAARKAFKVDGPHFLGHVISHVVLDPRDRRTLLAAAKTGHLDDRQVRRDAECSQPGAPSRSDADELSPV